ncbi:unnamed protein product, partial [Porites evermanni]
TIVLRTFARGLRSPLKLRNKTTKRKNHLQKEHSSEHQNDASPYEAKPNSSDDEPDYKPSIISKVQAFEQGSIKDSGKGEQDKRQEPKREPKKLKPVHFKVTRPTTQPDDSERRKREAEIRPLGGVVKHFFFSAQNSCCTAWLVNPRFSSYIAIDNDDDDDDDNGDADTDAHAAANAAANAAAADDGDDHDNYSDYFVNN